MCSALPKSFQITPAELENALEEGMTFDGSTIDGFSRVQESDVLAMPDAKTFQLLPWHGHDEPVARVCATSSTSTARRSKADPATCCAGRSNEPGASGSPSSWRPSSSTSTSPRRHRPAGPPRPLDPGSYFDLTETTCRATCAAETVLTLEDMGIPVEYASTRTPRASTRSTCATPTP